MSSSPKPGIPADAYSYVLKRLAAPPSQLDQAQLREALKGVDAKEFIVCADYFFSCSGLKRLTLTGFLEMAGWFRQFDLRDIWDGIKLAVERAPRLGHTITSPAYFTPPITQIANDPARREARAGRGPQ